MIPPLNEHGYLPPGIHRCTMEEYIERFGVGSEQREAQAESLRWLIPLCHRAHISRILINGSFVTDRLEPNDVDIVLLQGSGYSSLSIAAAELRLGLPFLEIRTVNSDDYAFFSRTMFAADRHMTRKGMLEVIL